jgi:hypothetical protein
VPYSHSGYAMLLRSEATLFESLSDLEEDLDRLLKLGDEGATACQGGPVFDNYSDLDDDPSGRE